MMKPRKIGNWSLDEDLTPTETEMSSKSKYALQIKKYTQKLDAIGSVNK